MDLLNELLKGVAFNPTQDTFDAQAVHNKLEKAADDEEVETVTFGLETDDGKIIKVYVAVEDADAFEEELGKRLGEEDNIENLIDDLSTEYDIVDVDWGEEEDEEEEDSSEDGSDSLNDKVNYTDFFGDDDVQESVSVGNLFKDKVLKEEFDDEDGLPEFDDDKESDTGDIDEGDYVVIDPVKSGEYGEVEELAPSGSFAIVKCVDGKSRNYHVSDLQVIDEDPFEYFDEISDEEFDDEEDEDDIEENIDSIGSRFTAKATEDNLDEADDIDVAVAQMDPEFQKFFKTYGKTAYSRLGLLVLSNLGIPSETLSIIKSRRPTFVRDIGIIMKELGGAGRNRIAKILGIDMDVVSHGLGEDTVSELDDENDDENDSLINTLRTIDRDKQEVDDFEDSGDEENKGWDFLMDEGKITMMVDDFAVEFGQDETQQILNAFKDNAEISINDIDNLGPYNFVPTDSGYKLETQEDGTFEMSTEEVDEVLGL